MQVLLSRYSRSDDVVTGVATDRAAGPDVARLIGHECNPVALRTSFAGTNLHPMLPCLCLFAQRLAVMLMQKEEFPLCDMHPFKVVGMHAISYCHCPYLPRCIDAIGSLS